jgi:hypothetical protein
MPRKKHMTAGERRFVAFHEAGHLAMIYWRRESLHERRVVLHTDRFGGSSYVPAFDSTEWDLMVSIGGPMAEFLAMGIEPKRPLLFRNEYKDANSDSTRIKNLVKKLRGKDDRRYLFQVQERCREIIQEPRLWQALTLIAERLVAEGELRGEKCQEIFER